MEGNKFLDPETPPSIDLASIHPVFTRGSYVTAAKDDESGSEKSLGRDFNERVDIAVNSSASSSSAASHSNTIQRRKSHADHAIHLVDAVTKHNNRRRPSRGGILSNLLKLDLFEEKSRRQRQQGSSSAAAAHLPQLLHPKAGSTSSISLQQQQKPQLSRPTYQLRSIASSRALLQTVGATPQSARSSMYFEDLHKAELGITDDASVAAHRMAIASEIADILQRQDLIIKLGKSLVRTGAPSHRIEAAMEKVGKRLEIDGNYAVLPGLIIVTFGDVETHTSETHLIRCSRSLDIGKLERSNVIAYRIAKGELGLEEATTLLDGIINEPPTWSPPVVILGYIVTSAFVAPLFYNGSWTDCWVSALFGLCERLPMFGNVFEMVVTIPVAVVTLALHPHVCFAAVAMAAIVIALPGYSLTCSVMELAAKNLISGTVHLVYALMYVLFLAFGIGYGCSIWRLGHPDQTIEVLGACQESVNPWWIFLILPIATVGFGVVYGASPNQWLPMVGDSAAGYAVYYFVARYAGSSSVITPSAGAFVLGCCGNLYARLTKRLAFVPIMGGVIILVPGSIGVKGAVHLFDGSNNGSGSEFVFQVLGIALSLTLGLFLANLVIYPTGKKRSVFLGF
ncbi:hypothetical protein [Parasitella parasitica]|uniref:Threonine/serine exporter-like N-terminal domain-containing protein n=1 Tax=Parasitella parasitica TaxID=35722 RepID=A0A0B7NKM3_9FUNG|nr:hypothetical protein [Parasitella parasitica]